MKSLQILGLLVILAFSSAFLAQEKETEKPKEAEKSKVVEKPKGNELRDAFRKSNNPRDFIVTLHSRNIKVRHNPIPDVKELELIFDEIAKDVSNTELCFSDKLPGIEVITKANNPNSDALIYHYIVSGGKIIGQGEKVNWDLSGVKPDTYTITAAVEDGCGFCGKTMTKTVIVKE